jgi:ABC-type ATPase involved in cell division
MSLLQFLSGLTKVLDQSAFEPNGRRGRSQRKPPHVRHPHSSPRLLSFCFVGVSGAWDHHPSFTPSRRSPLTLPASSRTIACIPNRTSGGVLVINSTVPSVELEDVCKSYGHVEAVKGVSFSCHDGEFLTVLGPSGSGKTTILRIIAGFEQPTQASRLAIAGQSVVGIPAYRRDVSTVFQQYALFPHKTVGQNVEYSLKVRGIDRVERQRQAQAMLDLVRLGHTYGRRINQLSGGEQQRVALARALVARPGVLLLD